MKNRIPWLVLALGVLCAAPAAQASSHREALAILNEPCADNTDTYAWVSDGAHDKLYLIMSFSPLHEPGQGNQGLRACDGYRYSFHIGKGPRIADKMVYSVEFKKSVPNDGAPSPTDPLGGGNELLYQLTGSTETMTVKRFNPATGQTAILGRNLPVAPNNHGPQTDRLVYGLGNRPGCTPFQGYQSGDATSRTLDCYEATNYQDDFIHDLTNGGRVIAGQFDDAYQLDEKGIFDLVNLSRDGLFGIAGARATKGEDVFYGFNLFSIALEVPTSDLFPEGIPHNGQLQASSTDSLLRIWASIEHPRRQIVSNNTITGYRYEGEYVQVGRNALPLFNAALVGVARQTLYLRSKPNRDVSSFGLDILYPVLVRDADALGIYAALGIDPHDAGGKDLFGPRLDIIEAITLGRPIPIQDGFVGDVITLDAAIDSQFPNGRRVGGGTAPNKNQVDVSDVLISLIVAGNPAAGAGDGIDHNDKPYRSAFPFLAAPHSGLNQGHGNYQDNEAGYP